MIYNYKFKGVHFQFKKAFLLIKLKFKLLLYKKYTLVKEVNVYKSYQSNNTKMMILL